MSTSTDLMYNADSRYLHVMYKIYFPAVSALEVTRENYLMSSTGLDELYKASNSPYGDITSNEITITLYNDSGMFNPSNTDGQYYGLIKNGVRIEAFVRPDEVDEWDKLGTYFVTEWYTSSDGMSAYITANDKLHSVINGSVPSMPVYRKVPVVDFLNDYFGYFNLTVTVDEYLEDVIIPYVYTSEHTDNKAFLTDLMKGINADCFCDHDGNVRILSKVSKRDLRATLTDNDQIISIMIKQSTTTSYDSSTVTYNKCQESAEQTLVEITELPLEPGVNSTGKLTLSKHPVLCIKSLKTVGSSSAKITSFKATAKDFVGSVQSTDVVSVDFSVKGTLLEKVAMTLGESGDAPLEIKSEFIQEEDRARTIKNYADAYISTHTPTLELTIRGNPKLQLGDKVLVSSSKYKIEYTGIIFKASYEYVGSLSAHLTLIDASALEEV